MKTVALYRIGKEGLETCTAYKSQIAMMEKAGWSKDKPKSPETKPEQVKKDK